MGRFRKVDVRIWGDEKVRRLSRPAPNGRDCWLYLLTAKESTALPGVIPAGAGAMAESLKWPVEGFREAFQEVSTEGLAKADWEAGLVFIPNAVRYNPPESPNVVRAWGKAFDELPDSWLKAEIYDAISQALEGFGKGFREAFDKAFTKPSPSLRPALPESGAGTGAVDQPTVGAARCAPPAPFALTAEEPKRERKPSRPEAIAQELLARRRELMPTAPDDAPVKQPKLNTALGAALAAIGEQGVRRAWESFLRDEWARSRVPPCPLSAFLAEAVWRKHAAAAEQGHSPDPCDTAPAPPGPPCAACGRPTQALGARLCVDERPLCAPCAVRLETEPGRPKEPAGRAEWDRAWLDATREVRP